MTSLTKSDFKVARTCPTNLYYKKLNYPTTRDDDEYLELLEQGGYMVDAIAKLLFPEAIAINERNSQKALQATEELFVQENVTLLEAAFLSNGKFARPDIMLKRGHNFTLIEVRAKSYDGAEAQKRLDCTHWVPRPYVQRTANRRGSQSDHVFEHAIF